MLPEQDVFIEKLHRMYFKKLTVYAASVLKDTARAQDVVQDAFQEALLHVEKLMVHENPGGWLMETVKNKVKESERSRRRYLQRFFSLDTDFPCEIAAPGEQLTERREPDDMLPMEKVEQSLTPEEYQLLKRLILDRASHLEVAKELGITVYASQKRLERVRDKLYEVFPGRKRRKKK